MSDLLKKIKAAGVIKEAEVLSDSNFFNTKDIISTQLPILNVAFSGDLDGGLVPGLTIFAGQSKSFKTLLGLYCLKAYFEKYPESIGLIYDSEFGITPDYLSSIGIDTTRVLHIPIEHVEQLKFDIVQRLKEIKRSDKVFILVDSLGNLASKKEVEDAVDGKSVTDMSRAKAIRSLLRIITPHLTMKDLPCIVINHVYQTQELYSQVVIPGGTAVTYAANQIFVISKSQEKEGTDIVGWNFTININKSRFVREKSKLPFLVTYEGGINKWSGLMDIALEEKVVIKPSNGWYSRVNLDTGEVEERKWRLAETHSKEFWNEIINHQKFKDMIKAKYQASSKQLMSDEDIDQIMVEVDDE